jgi:hypothetical protein
MRVFLLLPRANGSASRDGTDGEDIQSQFRMANRRMRVLQLDRGLLHVETPLGIVNVRAGLTDLSGRKVDSVWVIPDRGVVRNGQANTRLLD